MFLTGSDSGARLSGLTPSYPKPCDSGHVDISASLRRSGVISVRPPRVRVVWSEQGRHGASTRSVSAPGLPLGQHPVFTTRPRPAQGAARPGGKDESEALVRTGLCCWPARVWERWFNFLCLSSWGAGRCTAGHLLDIKAHADDDSVCGACWVSGPPALPLGPRGPVAGRPRTRESPLPSRPRAALMTQVWGRPWQRSGQWTQWPQVWVLVLAGQCLMWVSGTFLRLSGPQEFGPDHLQGLFLLQDSLAM